MTKLLHVVGSPRRERSRSAAIAAPFIEIWRARDPKPGVPAAFGRDFHSSYMEWWLRSIGIDWIETIRYQPTLRTTDPERVLRQAVSDARTAALRLAP